MRALLKLFPAAHLVISALFVLSALGLLGFSGYELWKVVAPGENVAVAGRLGHVLDAIALLTIAVASLELAQTIVEEEVQREAHMVEPPSGYVPYRNATPYYPAPYYWPYYGPYYWGPRPYAYWGPSVSVCAGGFGRNFGGRICF